MIGEFVDREKRKGIVGATRWFIGGGIGEEEGYEGYIEDSSLGILSILYCNVFSLSWCFSVDTT